MSKLDDYLLKAKVDLDKRTEELDTIDSIAIFAFASRITTNQVIANNTLTAVNFNNTITDTRSAVITSPNWRFVAPVGGYYMVCSHIRLGLLDAGWAVGEIARLEVQVESGQTVELDSWANAASGGAPSLGGSVTVYAQEAKYIQINVHQLSGGDQNVETGTNLSWVSIIKIHGKT